MTDLPPSPLRLELRGQLHGLAERWDDLVEHQPLPSPFMKSWWVDNAAEGSVAILCCFDHSTLVGGAAFQLDRVGRGPVTVERVRCVGQGSLAPDHLDLLAAPGHEQAVSDLVLGWLGRPGSRLIDLDGLAATGHLAAAYSAHEISRLAAPFATLPATGPEYLAARPGKVRSTITRSRKRLEKDGVTLRRVDASTVGSSGPADTVDTAEESDAVDAVDTALDRLAELHDGRWSDESEFLQGWDRFSAAARAGARRGDVIIHELVVAGADAAADQVIAIELDLRAGSSLAFYQAGRRTEREWRGSGSVLRSGLIDWACAEGLSEYDLLRGDESYKADWADDRRELVRCRLGVGSRGRSVALAAGGWRKVEPTLRSAAGDARALLSPGSWRRRRATRDERTG